MKKLWLMISNLDDWGYFEIFIELFVIFEMF